jgi:hypothetical protein
VPGTTDDWRTESAEPQCGAVSHEQLIGTGLTAKQIKGLRRRKMLSDTPARGVYRVGGAERTWRQDLWVALLAAPEGTVASHLTAAALPGLVGPPAMPHVTVPRGSSGRFGGAEVHAATVPADDWHRWDGIPTTKPARTIVDCAAVLGQEALNKLVDAAIGRALCRQDDVLSAWARAGKVRGAARLRAALAPYAGGGKPDSVMEAQVLRRLHDWGFPPPACQYEIRDHHGGFVARVDFAWPEWRVVLEYDGVLAHNPRSRAADDRRQAAIEALGWQVVRADRHDLRPSATRIHSLLITLLRQPA